MWPGNRRSVPFARSEAGPERAGHPPAKRAGSLRYLAGFSIECLVVSLRHPDFSTKLGDGDVPGSNPFGNTDDDYFTTQPAGSSTNGAMEILDPWGTPIIYIPKNLYGQTFQVINADGDEVDVEAVRRRNGTYYNQSKFQIICLGKNGKQDMEPGEGDDIMNFKIEDE